MSVKDPIHLIFGYVEIRASGGFAERFINLCTADGIPLWDIHKRDDKITAKTTASGYRKIRAPSRQSSMKTRIMKKHGLPFLLNRCFHHSGLIIGFAIMILTLSILSGRIWIIEVDNGTDIPDTDILSAYENAGFRIGSERNVNMNALRSEVSASLKEASWTTVNIVGSTATIKVRKAKAVPPIDLPKGTSNIIALKDGQVELIEPYRGSAVRKAGQTVTEGELLISGVTESRIQSYIFSDADGYVAASTNIKLKKSFSNKKYALIPKSKKVYSIYFLGREIPLGKIRQSAQCYKNKSFLYIGGRKMPFGIFYSIPVSFDEKETAASEQENLLTAINDYSLYAYNSTLHAQNISKDISFTTTKNRITVSGNYFCYENIGKKVPFEVEESDIIEPESS